MEGFHYYQDLDNIPKERTGRMSGSFPSNGDSGNRLGVSRVKNVVIIQVFGLGNMFLAPTLESFVNSEMKTGFSNFIVDLRTCQGMDSTFMGTFIGLTAAIQSCGGWFCLVNVSPDNLALLKMLGILHVVPIKNGDFPSPDNNASFLFPTSDPYARRDQIHKAHRQLISANPENETRFGAFIAAMEEELAMDVDMQKETRSTESTEGHSSAIDDDDGSDDSDLPTILPPT